MAVARPAPAATILAGILTATLLGAPSFAATPEDGRRAYDAGRFTDAMGIWSQLSRQGSAEAAFGLGLLYDLGNGIPADPATAFFWYNLAAESGLPAAEFNVAAMFDAGRGVAQDSFNAALWYAKAASHGHHRAQFDIGLLYADGTGVPRNPDAAAAWLHLAAEGGLAAAANRLKEIAATARSSGPLVPVTASAPARNTTLPARIAVELVWIAPPQSQPVHFEVQVREFGPDVLKTVFTASLTQTSVMAQLPPTKDVYVWNVETVGKDGSRAPGVWNWFSVTDTEKPKKTEPAPQASR